MSWAERSATRCSAIRATTSTSSSRATCPRSPSGSPESWAAACRPTGLRDRRGALRRRRDRCRHRAHGDLPRACGATGGARRDAGGGPRPARLHDQRDRRVAPPRRLRAPGRPAPGPRRPRGEDDPHPPRPVVRGRPDSHLPRNSLREPAWLPHGSRDRAPRTGGHGRSGAALERTCPRRDRRPLVRGQHRAHARQARRVRGHERRPALVERIDALRDELDPGAPLWRLRLAAIVREHPRLVERLALRRDDQRAVEEAVALAPELVGATDPVEIARLAGRSPEAALLALAERDSSELREWFTACGTSGSTSAGPISPSSACRSRRAWGRCSRSYGAASCAESSTAGSRSWPRRGS